MGDQNKGILILLQITLQPFNMLLIQIVGRLIQKQDVWLFQKQLSQKHLGTLAAGKLGNILIHANLLQAQRAAYLFYLAVNDIKVMGHQKVLNRAQLLHHGIHLVLGCLAHLIADGIHLLFHLKQIRERAL